MALAQNGGLVIENGDPSLLLTAIPGTGGVVYLGGIRGADLNVIAMYWGWRWHSEIEPIKSPAFLTGQWGHHKRDIRGSTTEWSNHAAGEAWDTNAVTHPLGVRTLSAAQRTKIAQICTDLRGVIRSGAFYTGRLDEMHAERIGSYSQVAAVAAQIRAGLLPNVHPTLITNPLPNKPGTPTPQPSPAAPAPGTPPKPTAPIIEKEEEMVRLVKLGGSPVIWVVDFGAHTKWAVSGVDELKFLHALGIPDVAGDQPPQYLEKFEDITSGK